MKVWFAVLVICGCQQNASLPAAREKVHELSFAMPEEFGERRPVKQPHPTVQWETADGIKLRITEVIPGAMGDEPMYVEWEKTIAIRGSETTLYRTALGRKDAPKELRVWFNSGNSSYIVAAENMSIEAFTSILQSVEIQKETANTSPQPSSQSSQVE